MATIKLDLQEVKHAEMLPDLSMRCGRPATIVAAENLYWMPLWVVILLPFGPIPLALLALAGGKWRSVTAPLCARHRLHWRARTWIIVTIIGAALLGLVTTCVLAREVGWGDMDDLPALGFVLLLLCIILAVVIRITAIHAVDIGEEHIKLAGVSPAFAEALNAMRAAEQAESRATGSTEAIA